MTVRDREINYLQRDDIGGGHKWSCSFSKASSRTLFFLMAVMASGIATHKREWMS